MDAEVIFPKRLTQYVNQMGVRALDRLAQGFQPPVAPPEGEPAHQNAIASLVANWKAMSLEDKEQFVSRVAMAVVEVIAASSVLPSGLKLGRKVAKAGRKVIKKQAKRIRKATKKRQAAKSAASKPVKKKETKKR